MRILKDCNVELNPRVLDDIVQSVLDNAKEFTRCIVLFGSYARGDFEEYSDVDICIITDTDFFNNYKT